MELKSVRSAVALTLLILGSTVQAHTGHGTSGILQGLEHPFGLDHLLAMVAVGIWSVSALPTKKVWWGPGVFMITLLISAFAGTKGIAVSNLENLISLSVIIFGVMLVLTRFRMSPKLGLILIAMGASMHGLAHGAEGPESGFIAYAIGFLLTTGFLHFSGVAAGLAAKRYKPAKETATTSTVGLLLSAVGAYMYSQL
jgi:urease accessory protein